MSSLIRRLPKRPCKWSAYLAPLVVFFTAVGAAWATNPQVSPGGTVTLSPSVNTTLAMDSPPGWDVYNSANTKIASNVTPNSWTVTVNTQAGNYGVQNLVSFVVKPPSSATPGTNYLVKSQWTSTGGFNAARFDIVQPTSLTGISLNPTAVIGATSDGTNSTGTVTLSQSTSSSITVSLSSSNPSAATVPSTATIGAGTSSASFPVTSQHVTSTQTATITATYNGTQKTASLTINPWLSSLSISPSSVIGGSANATGTITLNAQAPANGIAVTMSSSNAAAATVPSTVLVPAGSTTASFTITSNAVTSNTPTTITASYDGVSASSNLTVTNGPPSTPTSVTATGGVGQVSLTWSGSTGAATYNVYRSTTAGGEGNVPLATGIANTSYSDTSVTAGTTYYYKVSATNSAGESALSSEVSTTTTAPPGTPSGLTSVGQTGQVALAWAAAAYATSYNVYRSNSTGNETTCIATNVVGTTYNDVQVQGNTAYFYKVSAVNSLGESPHSEEAVSVPVDPRLPGGWWFTMDGSSVPAGKIQPGASPHGISAGFGQLYNIARMDLDITVYWIGPNGPSGSAAVEETSLAHAVTPPSAQGPFLADDDLYDTAVPENVYSDTGALVMKNLVSAGTHVNVFPIESIGGHPGFYYSRTVEAQGELNEDISYSARIAPPATLSVSGATTDASGALNILIGQGITATFDASDPTVILSNFRWSVTGDTVTRFWVAKDSTGGGPISFTPQSTFTNHWYWKDNRGNWGGSEPETITVTADATSSTGQSLGSVTDSRTINVWAPTAAPDPKDPPTGQPSSYLSGDITSSPASGQDGMGYTIQIKPPTSGPFAGTRSTGELIQLCDLNECEQTTIQTSSTNSTPYGAECDNTCPYSGPSIGDSVEGDSPSVPNSWPFDLVTVNDQFDDYILYQPPGSDVCFVPVYEVDWNWLVNASADLTWNWSPNPPGNTSVTSSKTSMQYPVWNALYENGGTNIQCDEQMPTQ